MTYCTDWSVAQKRDVGIDPAVQRYAGDGSTLISGAARYIGTNSPAPWLELPNFTRFWQSDK
jgi:hypothetical protein